MKRIGILVALTLCCGCSAFGKRSPISEDVMRSRQLSQQGVEAMHHNQWENAEQRLAQAIEVCPLDYQARGHYAEVMLQRGESGRAREELETAIELSGGDSDLLVRLGQLHLAQGNLIEAERCGQRAVATGTNLPHAWALRGDALSHSDQLEQALTCYLRAASGDPGNLQTQMAIAEVYRRQGRPHRALSTLQAARERCPAQLEPQEMLLMEGLALQALNRPTEAYEVLSLAANRGPGNAEIFFRLGEAALMTGDPTAAQESARMALQIAPGHEGALRVLEHCGVSEPRVATAVGQ